jgi:hypothetical protein
VSADAASLTLKAERVAQDLMDANALAIESHEGVRLLLALAYLMGERDGADAAIRYMTDELRKIV